MSKPSTQTPAETYMALWEQNSPMRSFIYYVQRATCGALAYLVLHQCILGLRLMGLSGSMRLLAEWLLHVSSVPGAFFIQTFFDSLRPLNMPPALATFFLNIVIYFISVWIWCYAFNSLKGRSFTGKRGDPFALEPHQS